MDTLSKSHLKGHPMLRSGIVFLGLALLLAGCNKLRGSKNIEVKTVYGRSYKTISPVGSTIYKNDVWNFSVGYSFKIK